MGESAQSHHMKVLNEAGVEPYIVLPVSKLDRVTSLFDANKVSYWVDEEAISINGRPEIVYVTLAQRSDPEMVQRLLDSIF